VVFECYQEVAKGVAGVCWRGRRKLQDHQKTLSLSGRPKRVFFKVSKKKKNGLRTKKSRYSNIRDKSPGGGGNMYIGKKVGGWTPTEGIENEVQGGGTRR